MKAQIFAIVDGANFKDGPNSEEATDQIITYFQQRVEGVENPYPGQTSTLNIGFERCRQAILKEISQ